MAAYTNSASGHIADTLTGANSHGDDLLQLDVFCGAIPFRSCARISDSLFISRLACEAFPASLFRKRRHKPPRLPALPLAHRIPLDVSNRSFRMLRIVAIHLPQPFRPDRRQGSIGPNFLEKWMQRFRPQLLPRARFQVSSNLLKRPVMISDYKMNVIGQDGTGVNP